MARYLRKPATVEAIRWTGDNYDEVLAWFRRWFDEVRPEFPDCGIGEIVFYFQGQNVCPWGDWIVAHLWDGKANRVEIVSDETFRVDHDPVSS